MFLFVTDRPWLIRQLAGGLLHEGVFTVYARFQNAQRLLDEKPIGGVFLDTVSQIETAQALAARMIAAYPDLPIFALVEEDTAPDLPALRILHTALTAQDGDAIGIPEQQKEAARILPELVDFFSACGWKPELSSYYLQVGKDPSATRFMGARLPLSPREHTLLWFLFYRAPETVNADEILTVCFPEGFQKPSILPVLIGRINRKAKLLHPHPLIVSVRGKGYRISNAIYQ